MHKGETQYFFEDEQDANDVQFQTSWAPVGPGKKRHSAKNLGKRERDFVEEGKGRRERGGHGRGKGKGKGGKGGKGGSGLFKTKEYGMRSIPGAIVHFTGKPLKDAVDWGGIELFITLFAEERRTHIHNADVLIKDRERHLQDVHSLIQTGLKSLDTWPGKAVNPSPPPPPPPPPPRVFPDVTFDEVPYEHILQYFKVLNVDYACDFNLVYLLLSFMFTSFACLLDEVNQRVVAKREFTTTPCDNKWCYYSRVYKELGGEEFFGGFVDRYNNQTNEELRLSSYKFFSDDAPYPPLDSCIRSLFLRKILGLPDKVKDDDNLLDDDHEIDKIVKDLQSYCMWHCQLLSITYKNPDICYPPEIADIFLNNAKHGSRLSYNRVCKPVAGLFHCFLDENGERMCLADYNIVFFSALACFYTNLSEVNTYNKLCDAVLDFGAIHLLMTTRNLDHLSGKLSFITRMATFTSLDMGLHDTCPVLYHELLGDSSMRLGNVMPIGLDEVDNTAENSDSDADQADEELLDVVDVPHSRIYRFEAGIIGKKQLSYYIKWAIQRGLCTVKWTLAALKGMSMSFDYFSTVPVVTNEHIDELNSENTYHLRKQVGTLHNKHWFNLHKYFYEQISGTAKDAEVVTRINEEGFDIMKHLEIEEFTISKISSPLLLELCRTTVQSIVDYTPCFQTDKDVYDIDTWFRRFSVELARMGVNQGDAVKITRTNLITKETMKTEVLDERTFDVEIAKIHALNANFHNMLYRVVEAIHLAQEAKRGTFTMGLTNAKYVNMLMGAKQAQRYFAAKAAHGSPIYKIEMQFNGEPLVCKMYGLET